MATIKRANVILQIKDEDLDRYLGMGYSQINEKGEVVKMTTKPTSVDELQKQLAEKDKKIKELEAKLEALTSEPAKEEKEDIFEEAEAEEDEEKSKAKKKK